MAKPKQLTTMENKKNLSTEQHSALLQTLKDRFEKNTNRHKDLEWRIPWIVKSLI